MAPPASAAALKRKMSDSGSSASRKSMQPVETVVATATTTVSNPTVAKAVEVHRLESPSSVKGQSPVAHVLLRTLVLDNGGNAVKFGWAGHGSTIMGDGTLGENFEVEHMPNVTARLPQQWTVLTGDEIHTQVTNPNSCIALTRSTERGIITNMGNQIQVWKRVLDKLHVTIPLGTDTATVFGWNNTTKSAKTVVRQPNTTSNRTSIPSHQCAVLIGLPPHTMRSVLDQTLTIWLDDFGFARAGFFVSAAAAAIYRPIPLVKEMLDKTTTNHTTTNNTNGTVTAELPVVPIACVVDLGWSATHVVPVYRDKVIDPASIRRMPLGARQLINIWKYYCSYRQWNLMDAEWIMRDVFEKTAQISLQFAADMAIAHKIPVGRRPYDCEYVLPDYDTTFVGRVQIPDAVRRAIELQKPVMETEEEENDYDEENDEDYDDDEMNKEENHSDVDLHEHEGVLDSSDGDEDENLEERRKLLLKQREEEVRRRELEAEQHQVLNISVERFAVVEALFRPSDVGLPSEWANLPQTIVEAIEACPAVYRAGLYRSIQLTGGLSQLANLTERLEQELRALAPSHFPLNISASASPVDQAWKGARRIASEEPYTMWSVSREEWEKSSRRGAWKLLLVSNGGFFV